MFYVKYILFYTFVERNDFVLWFLRTFCQYSCYKKSTVGADKKKTTFYQSYLFLRNEERVYLLFLNFLYRFQPNTIPSKTPAPVLNNPENRLDGKLVVNEDGDVPNN